MVMEIGVRDSYPFRRMNYVDEPIIVVLAVIEVGRHVTRVNPHIRRLLDRDTIPVVGLHLGDLHVPDDDILLAENREADPCQA